MIDWKVGMWVNCEWGLGQVREIDCSSARVYIPTFGIRWVNLNTVAITGDNMMPCAVSKEEKEFYEKEDNRKAYGVAELMSRITETVACELSRILETKGCWINAAQWL